MACQRPLRKGIGGLDCILIYHNYDVIFYNRMRGTYAGN